MKIRSRWLNVLGSGVLTLAVAACGDDGSDGTSVDAGADGGLDAGGESGETADGSVAPDDSNTDVNPTETDSGQQTVDVTLDPSDDSTDAGSSDGGAVAVEDASSVTSDSSNEDSGTSDATQDTDDDTTTVSAEGDASADTTTITSEPTDASATASDVPDASDETTTVQTGEPDSGTNAESSSEETLSNDTSVATDEVDASVDSGEETTTDPTTTETNAPTSDIQTSDVTTGASEAYWAQSIWSGYVLPFGSGEVTIDDGVVCVSGNEVGTVGLRYNVNQAENGDPAAYAPDGNDVGIDLSIVSAVGGQVRFSAGDTEYCAQAVEGETFYFWFWDRFSDCATGTLEYDGQTPFESIGIVLSAAGEYELCVDKFNVGELADGGVLPVEAGVSFDASIPDPT